MHDDVPRGPREGSATAARRQAPRARFALLLACAALVLPPTASARPSSETPPGDPLLPLVHRMDVYFQGHEVDGVTMDSRYDINPSEAIRMSVVCQALGYAELCKHHPSARFRREVADRADYLIAHLDLIRSMTPFDGMLGYGLLEAYAVTREPRFLAGGQVMMDELMAIPTSECILNGGLMVAMATADHWLLTGSASAQQKTHDILAQLPPYQNSDGSFPHWCPGSEDIHYTGWMAQELNLIERITADPLIEPILGRMLAFMDGRVDTTGHSSYSGPCPGIPNCTQYYYSRASGCSYDYDTRGWTVEPAYNALLFDRFPSAKYLPTVGFLVSLENGGTFKDVWDYWPPPSDPEYPWTIADTSVANMSIIFWVLSCIVTERTDIPPAEFIADDGDANGMGGTTTTLPHPAPGSVSPAPSPKLELRAASPNPARVGCSLYFALPRAAPVSLTIYDAGGRRVRELVSEALEPGEHVVRWDLRDADGAACRCGLYFARLRSGDEAHLARVLVLR